MKPAALAAPFRYDNYIYEQKNPAICRLPTTQWTTTPVVSYVTGQCINLP